MMNPEFKERWVKALRSGKYKQGQGRLISRNQKKPSYCCLGVLCKVSGLRADGNDAFKGACYVLPRNLRLDIGITVKQQDRLVTLNDTTKNFIQIANWIEKYL